MCLYATLVDNPKYKRNKKNGGKPPFPIDPRVTKVPIACGNCIECRKQIARNWQIRLLEEIKNTPHGVFVTLTLSSESIEQLRKHQLKGYTLDNYIAKTATRYFLERWRKKHKKYLRHWLITELGHQGTENVHLHGLLWFQNKTDINKLDEYWQYGYTFKGTYVSERTINYISKYITKIDLEHQYYKPIILTSNGMGAQYTKTENYNVKRAAFKEAETKDTYVSSTGHEMALPIYYRNKIYTEEQREALWLHKLDKQTRYVLGQAIDVSQTPEVYLNILEYARQKNQQLGYRTNKINYDQKKYENQMREIQYETRKQKLKLKIHQYIMNNTKEWPEAPF